MSLFGELFKSEAEKRAEMDISDARLELGMVRQFVLDAFALKDYVLFEDAVSESDEARDIVHRAFAGLVDAGGYRMWWIKGAGVVVERVVG